MSTTDSQTSLKQKKCKLETQSPTTNQNEETPTTLEKKIKMEDFPYSAAFFYEEDKDDESNKEALRCALLYAARHACTVCGNDKVVPTQSSDPTGERKTFPLFFFEGVNDQYMCTLCAHELKQYTTDFDCKDLFYSHKSCIEFLKLTDEERVSFIKAKKMLARHCFVCGFEPKVGKEKKRGGYDYVIKCHGKYCRGLATGNEKHFLCDFCNAFYTHRTSWFPLVLCSFCKEDTLKEGKSLSDFVGKHGSGKYIDIPLNYPESNKGIAEVANLLGFFEHTYIRCPVVFLWLDENVKEFFPERQSFRSWLDENMNGIIDKEKKSPEEKSKKRREENEKGEKQKARMEATGANHFINKH